MQEICDCGTLLDKVKTNHDVQELPSSRLIVYINCVQCIGHFGLVYKGDWFTDVSAMPTTVAVKTLKGEYKESALAV